MTVELQIPGYLVLIAALVGGGVVCGLLFISAAKAFFGLSTARHNYMAHALETVKQRNNDYEPIEQDEFEGGWKYRVVDFFLRKHRRERE